MRDFFASSNRTNEGERGAVAVLVALLMVALLGFAAISIDVARLYAEEAELQNGADAAAMAIAKRCADGSCGDINTLATQLAAGNSGNNFARANPTVAGKTVTVETSTLNSDGSFALAHWFAPVLGIDSTEVRASAKAAWGSPRYGPAMLPLTFSECVFNPPQMGVTQLIQYNITSGDTCVGRNNQAVPGGFGWLKKEPGSCSAIVAPGAVTFSDTGNNMDFPDECLAELNGMKNSTILIPVFDRAGGTGSNAWYNITEFAAFKITGWRFGGPARFNWNNGSCTGNCRGIIGSFQNFVTIQAGFTGEGEIERGAQSAALTE